MENAALALAASELSHLAQPVGPSIEQDLQLLVLRVFSRIEVVQQDRADATGRIEQLDKEILELSTTCAGQESTLAEVTDDCRDKQFLDGQVADMVKAKQVEIDGLLVLAQLNKPREEEQKMIEQFEDDLRVLEAEHEEYRTAWVDRLSKYRRTLADIQEFANDVVKD